MRVRTVLSLTICSLLAPLSVLEKPSIERPAAAAKQLLAVRGEVTQVARRGKGLIAIRVTPASDFAEATVIARENQVVGWASGRESQGDLLGLLAGDDTREDEKLTAAELQAGDLVSVIYDPLLENRCLEIYLH